MALYVGIPGLRLRTVTADPGAVAATTAADVDVTVSDVDATDFAIIVQANPTLEVRLILESASIPSADVVRLRFKNQSALAATGGALAHVVGIIKQP